MLQSKSTIPSLLLLTMAFLMGGGTAADPIDTECKGKGGPTLRKQVLNQLIESMNGAMPLQGKEVQQATNYLNLAFCYKKEKDETEATNNFQRAVNLHPALLSQYAQFFGPVADPTAHIMAEAPPVLHQLDPNLKVGKHLLDADGEFLDPYMDIDMGVGTDQLGTAMQNVGMKNCNLIFGIDYTASNVWQGKWTFEGENLHHPYILNENFEKAGVNVAGMLEDKGRKMPPAWMIKNAERNHPDDQVPVNPYERVIALLGQTLDKPEFDADGLIPAFGFGDFKSKGFGCFNLKNNLVGRRENNWNIGAFYTNMAAQSCVHVPEVLAMYQTKTPHMHLSGPTNIGPIIRQAIEIVKKEGTYHMLVIVADGQIEPAGSVTDSVAAIEEASHHPLSIILVGVGDGPWHTMIDFDDNIKGSQFDNFQFVNFHEIVEQADNPEASFAYYTLEEVNTQYTYIKQNILPSYKKHPQPPPLPNNSRFNSRMPSFNQRQPTPGQGNYIAPPQHAAHGNYYAPQQQQPMGMQGGRANSHQGSQQWPQPGMGHSNAANAQPGQWNSYQAGPGGNNIWQQQ